MKTEIAPESQAPIAESFLFPCSFAQERLWFLQNLEPGNFAYNLVQGIRIVGDLKSDVLLKAIHAVVRRHDSLRTTFVSVDGKPLQFVCSELRIDLPESSLENGPLQEQVIREAQKPFDLGTGPLIRARLIRLAANEHYLLLILHHIIADGWSIGTLVDELIVCYEALLLGIPPRLPELPIQYCDYSIWQREWLTGATYGELADYWKNQMHRPPPQLILPADRKVPERGANIPCARLSVKIPDSLVSGVRALAEKENATLFMVLLAAFQVLLYRYTGQNDFVVGSAIAGRTRPEIEDLIGFFVNTLALRTPVCDDMSFSRFLQAVRRTALGAFEHQEMPFEKLVEEVQPERHVRANPVFNTVFVLQNAPRAAHTTSGLKWDYADLCNGSAKTDLNLSVYEEPDGLRAELEYRTDLFVEASARQMLGCYQKLLQSAVESPDTPVARLPMLDAEQLRTIVVEWNNTEKPFTLDVPIHRMFEEQARKTPDHAAVVSAAGKTSYRELNTRADDVATQLLDMGLAPGEPVGISLPRSNRLVAAIIGILKAGGCYVPFDRTDAQQRLQMQLEDCGARILITDDPARINDPRVTTFLLDDRWWKTKRRSSAPPKPPVEPESTAYIIYTSGSTGKPKGVQVPHRAVANFIAWYRNYTGLTPADHVSMVSTPAFDASVLDLWPTITTGASLHVSPRDLHLSADFVSWLVQERITHCCLTTPLAEIFVQRQWPKKLMLRVLVAGGDALHPVRRKDLPFRFINGYGPTETTVCVTWFEVVPGSEQMPPIGKPVDNVRVYVLDSELQPVPAGVAGELYIGGKQVANGYIGNPELTAARFLPDPFTEAPGAKMYKTGDLVRWCADGNLEFLGRIDTQVKIRGYRIEPAEIEAAISEFPGVKEVVVAALDYSANEKRLVAYLAVAGPLNEKALRTFLEDKLPAFMLPWKFVALEALPLNASGKVDRAALPGPVDNSDISGEHRTAPRDEIECRLLHIWENVLAARPIGIRDNFFDLGGHSLLAVRLFYEIEKQMGRSLPISTLFEQPTIEGLAEILRNREWTREWASLVPIQPNGSRPPFFCIHAGGGHVMFYKDFARRLGPDQPFYAFQAVGLDGERPPHKSVEEMAEFYLQELRQFQPHGPYYLGGASIGGLVAFEMARRLHETGERTAMLALFDTFAPGYPKYKPGTTRLHKRVYAHYRQVEHHIGSLLLLTARERWNYVREKALKAGKVGKKLFKRRTRLLFSLLMGRLYQAIHRPLPKNLEAAAQYIKESSARYAPSVYAGRITLFRADRQPLGVYPDPLLGWGGLAEAGIEIHEVPGYHGSIVSEPRVRFLVEKFEPCLRRAQQQDLESTKPLKH